MRKHNTSIFAFSTVGLFLISHFVHTAGDRSTASRSCAAGVLVWLTRSRGEWIAPAGLATLGTAALSYATPIIRSGGPTRRRIALTKQGVELTRINGRTDTIPWRTRPTW